MPALLKMFVVALVSGLLCPAALAQAPACGAVLTQSLILAADLFCGPGQNGLVVGADDVTIDLNGHRISGSWSPGGIPQTIGIESQGFRGTRITHGTIEGFAIPIYLALGKEHVVAKINASDENLGVFMSSTSFSTVQDSELHSVLLGARHGRYAYANQIRDNLLIAYNNAGGRIDVEGCFAFENVVTGNVLFARPGTNTPAIFVSGGSYGNAIVGNTVNGHVEIRGSFNSVRENRVTTDPRGPSAVALLATGSRGTTFCRWDEGQGNEVLDNTLSGGLHGVQVLGIPPPFGGPPFIARKNRIHANTFGNQSVSGLLFATTAEDNDGRVNTFIALPVDVIDQGRSNLWP